MSAYEVLGLWWVLPAGVALSGYAVSLAGLTRAQRAVWVSARVVRVGRLAHGASKRSGLPVAITFRDPSTRREFVLRNTGRHGDVVHEAWVGREFEVRYPPGHPHRFRIVLDTAGEKHGRIGSNCAVALLLVGSVVHAAAVRGYPWALLGFGALFAAFAAASPDIRQARARDALMASAVAVPARVVAVTMDVYTDGEGEEFVSHAPVVRFTTREGTEVTVLSLDGIPDPGLSLDRSLTVHYAPTDPAVWTADPAADRRGHAKAVGTIVTLLAVGAAAVATGLALL